MLYIFSFFLFLYKQNGLNLLPSFESLSALSFHFSLQLFCPCVGPFPVTLIPITYIPFHSLAHVEYTHHSYQMSKNTLVQPPPPLSPTMTVSTSSSHSCQEQQQKEKDKYTVIDLEKNDTLNREEIVIHYPDYDEEATIQAHHHDPYRTTTSSTKTGNGCFRILTRLRRFRRKVRYPYTHMHLGFRVGGFQMNENRYEAL